MCLPPLVLFTAMVIANTRGLKPAAFFSCSHWHRPTKWEKRDITVACKAHESFASRFAVWNIPCLEMPCATMHLLLFKFTFLSFQTLTFTFRANSGREIDHSRSRVVSDQLDATGVELIRHYPCAVMVSPSPETCSCYFTNDWKMREHLALNVEGFVGVCHIIYGMHFHL